MICIIPFLYSGSSSAPWRLSGLYLALPQPLGAYQELCLAFAQSRSACQGCTMPLLCGQCAAFLRLCRVMSCYAIAVHRPNKSCSAMPLLCGGLLCRRSPRLVSLCIAITPRSLSYTGCPASFRPVTFCRRTARPCIAMHRYALPVPR